MAKKKQTVEFDYENFEKEAIKKLREGKGLVGPDGALTGLIKRILESALEGEMDDHLAEQEGKTRRNGHTKKQLKTSLGEVPIEPPRDRSGAFEPKIVGKWERRLAPELEQQVLELYGMGNSYQDIQRHLENMYGVHYSTGLLSAVTDRVWDEIEAWRNRPLESLYVLIYLDAIHYKIREDRQVKTKAVYTVFGVNSEGYRDVLGIYIDQAEGAKYWGRVLDNLKDRGVEDVLFFSVDGLAGFSQSIEQVFPQSIIQRCIVHMVRTSLKNVSYKDYKALCRDLRKVYGAETIESAWEELQKFGCEWDGKYPGIRRKWEKNWLELTAYFDYPEEIRRMIYTTNAIEALHRQIRKITKTKGAFVSDEALIKQLYLGLQATRKSWARRVRDWPPIIRVLHREFSDRLNQYQLE